LGPSRSPADRRGRFPVRKPRPAPGSVCVPVHVFPVRSPISAKNIAWSPHVTLDAGGDVGVHGVGRWVAMGTSGFLSCCESVGVSPLGAKASAVAVVWATHRSSLNWSSRRGAPASRASVFPCSSRQAVDVSRHLLPYP
jgi:hypothetical protein